jgi:hypothetical protein
MGDRMFKANIVLFVILVMLMSWLVYKDFSRAESRTAKGLTCVYNCDRFGELLSTSDKEVLPVSLSGAVDSLNGLQGSSFKVQETGTYKDLRDMAF